MNVLVFYAGQLLDECTYTEWAMARKGYSQEIYNGAYVYEHRDSLKKHWYRLDGTPVLLEDVPKELRLLVLLLT